MGEWSGSGKQTGERMGEQRDVHEQIGGRRMDRRMGKPMADAAGAHGDSLAAHGRR